jgi:hypothetical protein
MNGIISLGQKMDAQRRRIEELEQALYQGVFFFDSRDQGARDLWKIHAEHVLARNPLYKKELRRRALREITRLGEEQDGGYR